MSTAVDQKRPIILSGPSGAGKSTLIKALNNAHPGLFGFSVSHTTRSPRDGEQHGREYHFTDKDAFQAMIARGEFLEWAQFSGNYYGTSKSEISRLQSAGQIPLLDIDMEGVKSVLADPVLGSLVRTCAIQPPSVEALRARLTKRGTESEDKVKLRLEKAEEELAFAKEGGRFETVVVNDDVDRAFKQLEAWIFGR